MELEFETKEKVVGFFVIVIFFLLLLTVVLIGHGKGWFKSYVTYYMTLKETYNLQENAPVKLHNAEIGKVKDIRLIKDKVRVQVDILEEYASRIRKNTIAMVESPTFIGSEYVAIIPGEGNAALVPAGGEIQSVPKRSISDILREFEVEKTAKKLIKAVQDISEVAQILRDPNGPLFTAMKEINKTLGNVAKISEGIEEGKGTVGGILKSRDLFENIEKSTARIEIILKNVEQASSKAPAIMDNANNAVENLTIMTKKLDGEIGKIKVILANIEKGSRDVPEITDTTRKGIREIRQGVEQIDTVFDSLKKSILIRGNIPGPPEARPINAR